MAVRYYDDAIIQKLLNWMSENSNLRILRPDESKRLFELAANDSNDSKLKMPFIALSRNNDIELISNIKQLKSFNGLKIVGSTESTASLNVIPIKLEYRLDIYAKKSDECEEYLRNFLFKLINNPVITIEIPYNSKEIKAANSDICLKHIANIRVLNTVSDTSDISERLFSGQFYRWTIPLEIQDAFLFSVPYRRNWKINGYSLEDDKVYEYGFTLETADSTNLDDPSKEDETIYENNN